MMLEDAIKHAEEVVEEHEKIKRIKAVTLEECKCAAQYRQLAEWLKELKRYKEYGPCAFCKHNTFEESAPCFRCPAGMSFAENVIVKISLDVIDKYRAESEE